MTGRVKPTCAGPEIWLKLACAEVPGTTLTNHTSPFWSTMTRGNPALETTGWSSISLLMPSGALLDPVAVTTAKLDWRGSVAVPVA